jgi:3-oxoacyl-[acyl-carrier protein] reductase
MPRDLGLKDKIAVITGGSVGIGLAVAEALADEGVHLLLCARDKERVQQKAAEIADKYGVRAIGIAADVAKAIDCEAVIQAAQQEYNSVDILINNAGTGSNEKIMTAEDEKWQYYWDLHVMAAVRLARGLAPDDERTRWWLYPEQRLHLCCTTARL